MGHGCQSAPDVGQCVILEDIIVLRKILIVLSAEDVDVSANGDRRACMDAVWFACDFAPGATCAVKLEITAFTSITTEHIHDRPHDN
jgi:hypothetical protein